MHKIKILRYQPEILMNKNTDYSFPRKLIWYLFHLKKPNSGSMEKNIAQTPFPTDMTKNINGQSHIL